MKPGVLRLFPQTGAAAPASADSSYLSTPLGDRRWQVALAQMSFRARGREIRSDGAVAAEDLLREQRGGAPRGEGGISLREGKMCAWGVAARPDGKRAQRRVAGPLSVLLAACFWGLWQEKKGFLHTRLKQQVRRVPSPTSGRGNVGETGGD